MSGPLTGKRIIEMVGLGPAPFCGMMLADMGAEVIRIDRPGAGRDGAWKYDILFRPGVMEKMGLGPEVCQARNPALVYGRMTGWGQHGPLAHAAGHDMNYIAISGALHAIGRADEPPVVPLNLVGDFGGGGMLLTVGILAAMLEAGGSGKGQVVDAAMTDGAALLSSMMYGFRAAGQWSNSRGENLLDGGAHFYDVYTCADGRYVAVGAIEPKFYAELLERCGLEQDAFEPQMDPRRWPMLKLKLADVFRTRTRDEWCEILEGTDACFAPVLDWDEAPLHPHNRARQTFVEAGGFTQPAPAPRFSRTPSDSPAAPTAPLEDAADVLADWGLPDDLIRFL